jgi:hypothetical protein
MQQHNSIVLSDATQNLGNLMKVGKFSLQKPRR